MSAIGERIRDARKSSKKTQKEFAQALDMSENYIWQIEKGQRDPSERTLNDICRIFGINPDWLHTGEGDMFPARDALDELNYLSGRFLANSPTEFQQRFARMMFSLTPDEWELLERKARELLEEK